jgi:hypothetical protein
MQTLKAVFKSQTPIDYNILKESRCLLTISVGQEVHEEAKFLATVELVNSNFASCIMLIDDSLQRHSMALNQTQNADYFYEAAIIAGDAWLARNQTIYQKLKNLEEIVRWDRWLQHPHYQSQQEQIKNLLTEKKTYQQRFDETIHTFLSRNNRLQNTQLERAEGLCLDYLIEECTALCLWPEMDCHFELYPSKRNLAMTETHQHFVLPQYPTLLHPIGIKFKNRKQLKPQHFAIGENA